MWCFLLPHKTDYYYGCVKYSVTFQTDEANCIKEVKMLLHEYIDNKKKENTMEDYKTRMVNEYKELKEKYTKLHNMLVKYDAGKLDFTPTCPIELLRKQASVMGQYLYILETRAVIEDVDLKAED